jgi:hypothetical protein
LEVKRLDHRLQLSKQSPVLGSKKVFGRNPVPLAFRKLELYKEILDVIHFLDTVALSIILGPRSPQISVRVGMARCR